MNSEIVLLATVATGRELRREASVFDTITTLEAWVEREGPQLRPAVYIGPAVYIDGCF